MNRRAASVYVGLIALTLFCGLIAKAWFDQQEPVDTAGEDGT